jgi:hypothetical protein
VGSLNLLGSTYIRIKDAADSNTAAEFNPTGASAFYYNNAQKLATTNTGVDITGTLTSDGLTVDGDAAVAGTIGVTVDSGTIQTGKDSASSRSHLVMNNPNGVVAKWDTNGTDLLHYVTDEYKLYTAGNKAFEVDGNGDISFYEDTGTTPKFFWDASAESLGIGTISPTRQLDVSKAGTAYIRASDTSSSVNMEMLAASSGGWIGTQTNHSLNFQTNNTERLRIDSGGNVGIGTSSPSYKVTINTPDENHLRLENGSELGFVRVMDSGAFDFWAHGDNSTDVMTFRNGSGAGSERMRIDSSGRVGVGTTVPTAKVDLVGGDVTGGLKISADKTTSAFFAFGADANETRITSTSYGGYKPLTVHTGGSERMRIDSSGHFLFAKTSTSSGVAGIRFAGDAPGYAEFTRDGGNPLYLNRETGDGEIIRFAKDDSTVGSIGSAYRAAPGDSLFFVAGDTGFVASPGDDSIVPATSNGAGRDNAINLGISATRFKDLYLSGTANAANFNTTSDATLKTNVETLSGSLDAVTSLRGVSFDWLENGGSEIGVIAQEVEAVLPDVVSTNDEGIKSVKYGNMVAVLIEAIKEQQAQIDELKAKLGE